MSERVIEMTWHCATCKHQNRGRDKICQSCGKPKGDEEFEMPSNTEAAPTVTDDALLRMASAGPDWKCAYCGSNQRALDGSCGNCGASATDGIRQALAAEVAPVVTSRKWVPWAIAGGAVAVVAIIAIVAWPTKPTRATAMVTAIAWEQSIQVEHYANHEHEGFVGEIPAGATDQTPIGKKVHHTEQVFDHMETEHYTETVPDGYRTEHYTEQVKCGEDCRSSSPVCHEVCTSKKNGFASCRQVCSGGGQSCTPRYCSESRTREIPQTRTVDRTREVPRYRAEPIYAEAVRYKLWDWAPDRTETERGTSLATLRWPARGARESGLPEGERERETRTATYVVSLTTGARTLRFQVASPAVLQRFLPATLHELDAGQGLEEGRLLVDHEAFAMLPEQP